MKRWMAVLLVTLLAVASGPGLAWAGGTEDAALALGAFAVFNQLIRGDTVLHDLFGGRPAVVRETVIVHQPAPVVVAPPPVYAPAPVYVVPRPVVVYRPYPVAAPVVVVPRGHKVHKVHRDHGPKHVYHHPGHHHHQPGYRGHGHPGYAHREHPRGDHRR
jgi:hypothetical protein